MDLLLQTLDQLGKVVLLLCVIIFDLVINVWFKLMTCFDDYLGWFRGGKILDAWWFFLSKTLLI